MKIRDLWRRVRSELTGHHFAAAICAGIGLVMAWYGVAASAWITAAIIILVLGRSERIMMLAVQALLAREEQLRKERDALLRLARHGPVTHGRICEVCGLDQEHRVHLAAS